MGFRGLQGFRVGFGGLRLSSLRSGERLLGAGVLDVAVFQSVEDGFIRDYEGLMRS